MALRNTASSSARLLLNAEPFGFGPSAAIASIYPHLRAEFETVSYVGKHHTLDLQQGLDYTKIHDVSFMGKDEREDVLIPIMQEYDVFISAMDHKMVEIAQKAGLKTCYYDALAWYWKDIPQSVKQADLYMAQDFFGVEERLSSIFGRHAQNTALVSPIVSRPAISAPKEHVLINLGGLQNPYWPIEDITAFAHHVIDLAKQAIPADEKLLIACSQSVVERLGRDDVQTFPREQMQDVLSGAKWAFMTPGLGNIYDAAAYDIPTIWLPPANDSQGQQLRLLQAAKMQDANLDWHVFTDSAAVDYKAEQLSVLQDISQRAKAFTQDHNTRKLFLAAAKKAVSAVRGQSNTKTAQLLEKFGTGGEKQAACLIKSYLGRHYPPHI